MRRLLASLATAALVWGVIAVPGVGWVPNAAAFAESPPCPDTMVSYWQADGTAADSLDGNDGTVVGATYAAGVAGLSFATGVNQYVTVPDDPSLHIPQNVTIEAWVNPSTATGDRVILSKGDSTVGDGWHLMLRSGNTLAVNARFGTAWAIVQTAATIPVGTWRHVAFTYDGSQAALFIDGVRQASSTFSGSIAQNTRPLKIGTVAQNLAFFVGLIDEVAIRNEVLSDGELLDHHDRGLAGQAYCNQAAFEVHSGAGLFVKHWPVATTLTVTIDDPASAPSPDYATEVVTGETDEGYGGGYEIGYPIEPGNLVTVTDGTTTKSHTMIDIQVTSVDVDADRVSGTVPEPNSAVTVYAANAGRAVTADEFGNWEADFSISAGPDEAIVDIVAGDSGGAEQFDADGDSTVRDWEVPRPLFSVSPIDPPEHMWGEGWAPDAEVVIEIDDVGTAEAVDFSMTAGTDGNGRFELYDIPFDIEAGHVVAVSDGDAVKTHEVIDLRVSQVNPVTDTVSGVGAPNMATVVGLWDEQAQDGSSMTVPSDGTGAWTADFSGAFDILPGMAASAYQADEDGDQTQIDSRPPEFLVFLDWRGLAGWGWPAAVDVQVTADDPGTASDPDIELTLATDASGSFEGADVFPGVGPGWVVTVTHGTLVMTHTVRAISITDVDAATDVVRGTADPGTEVWVSVDGGEGLLVTADASGEWVADFAGLFDITVGTDVGVSQENAGVGTNVGTEVGYPPEPIPPGTSLTTDSFGPVTSGSPMVYWEDAVTVSTTGAAGGTATATFTMPDGYAQTIGLVEVPGDGGSTYTGTFAAPYPHHGPGIISTAISYPNGDVEEGSFTLYIDPSGLVRDTFGYPVAGAAVTLYRSVSPDGPFVPVADGSALMSPGNRTNPDLTGETGLFGWDVVPGYYKVRAERAGCTAPGGGAFVETDVLTIPPPVTDLELVLDCPGAPTALTYTGDTQVISPAKPILRATLADGGAACSVIGKTVDFSIDLTGDGDFDDPGETIGSAQTVAGTADQAVATLAPSPALPPGVYLVRLAFAGTSGCAASEDVDGIVSVVTPGDSASGGGWYQIAGATGASRNVSVGFTTRLDRKSGRYTGQILIHDKQAWRLKGEVTSFAKTSSNPPTGTVGGTGRLYEWLEVAPGAFDYVLVDASVTFKVTFTDTSTGRKGKPSTPDGFTVNWIGNYAGGAVSPLVTDSSFQPLKGGNITVR